MNKCKVVSKLGISQLIIKSQKGQQLSEREVYSINNNEVSGLLHLDVVSKGATFKLVYNITGFVTFKEYLKKALNKETFARILKNILENLKATQETFINQQMLLLDFEHVLVNPATEHIYFTCVPIQGIETGTSLRDFLLNIIQYSTFVPGEDNSYIREYITILNSGINFSVFELEEYINKLTGKNHRLKGKQKNAPDVTKWSKEAQTTALIAEQKLREQPEMSAKKYMIRSAGILVMGRPIAMVIITRSQTLIPKDSVPEQPC